MAHHVIGIYATAFYDDVVIDPSRHAVLWLLLFFILTTAATRTVTRAIRHRGDRAEKLLKTYAKPGILRNLVIAGIHVHHQVWGIMVLLFSGLAFATYLPGPGPWADFLASLFGIGAALTLDEFAMWLHLEDVYWREEGRTSISALIIAVTITVAVSMGANPFDVLPSGHHLPGAVIAAAELINLAFTIVTIFKGKLATALIGVFVPGVSIIGALRLAKPQSWWAQMRYRPDGWFDRRSRRRFDEHYEQRWNTIRDLIGGQPYTRDDLRSRMREQMDGARERHLSPQERIADRQARRRERDLIAASRRGERRRRIQRRASRR